MSWRTIYLSAFLFLRRLTSMGLNGAFEASATGWSQMRQHIDCKSPMSSKGQNLKETTDLSLK